MLVDELTSYVLHYISTTKFFTFIKFRAMKNWEHSKGRLLHPLHFCEIICTRSAHALIQCFCLCADDITRCAFFNSMDWGIIGNYIPMVYSKNLRIIRTCLLIILRIGNYEGQYGMQSFKQYEVLIVLDSRYDVTTLRFRNNLKKIPKVSDCFIRLTKFS